MVELLSVSSVPLSYEVLRHVLRVTEEDMIETLAETVRSGLVRRVEGRPVAYDLSADMARAVRESLGDERSGRLRQQVDAARERVHGAG